MSKELVSVVVPVYNVEEYLDECILSICGQTYLSLEIILVDDGSTDASAKLCERYSRIDKRVIVIHQPNKGLSAARNEGLKIARGEFICFIDSDDFLHRDMIQTLYHNLMQFEAQISIVGFKKFYANNSCNLRNLSVNHHELKIKVFEQFEAQKNLYFCMADIMNIACNKLYKKELFDDIIFPVGKIHEDMYVMHKLFYKCSKIVYSSDQLYGYRIRTGSITNAKFSKQSLDILTAYVDRIAFYKKHNEDILWFICNIKYLNQILIACVNSSKYLGQNLSNGLKCSFFAQRRLVRDIFFKNLFVIPLEQIIKTLMVAYLPLSVLSWVLKMRKQ